MDYPKKLMGAAFFFALVEGISLQEKIIQLLQRWVDEREAHLDQGRKVEKFKGKVIPFHRDQF